MAKSGLFGTGARVGPINHTAIQPTGIPGSTFVRAPVQQKGGNLAALASALGPFNSTLQNYASVQKRNEEDPQSRANQEQIARFQQMSQEERAEALATGNLPKVQEDAMHLLLGERASTDFRAAVQEGLANGEFDHTSGNFAEWYEQKRAEFAERLPSEISRGHLYRLTGQHFQSHLERDVAAKAEFVRGEMLTTITGGFRDAVSDARASGVTDPAALAEIVFSKSTGNRTFLRLSGPEQNATIFGLAEEFAAQGDEEMVRALLEGPRKGEGGKLIPALRDTHSYTTKALGLIKKAANIRDELALNESLPEQIDIRRMVQEGTFTDAEAEKWKEKGLWSDAQLGSWVVQSDNNRETALARAEDEDFKRQAQAEHRFAKQDVVSFALDAANTVGGINDIEDVAIVNEAGTGAYTYPRDQIIKDMTAVKEDEFNGLQQDLINSGASPDEAKAATDRKRMEWYADLNLPNRRWQNTLNGFGGVATLDKQKRGEEVTDYMRQGAALYRQLKDVNARYLSTLLTDTQSKAFFDAYSAALYDRGMSEDEALSFAAFRINSPTLDRVKSMPSSKETDRIVDRTLKSMGADRDRGDNTGLVAHRIQQMAEMGTPVTAIEERIKEEMAQNTVPINGVLVRASHDLPADFPEVVMDELQARFEEYGEVHGLDSAEDLAVVADGSENHYLVIDKRSGRLVGARPITAETLTPHRKRRAEEAEARFLALTEADAASREKARQEYEADIAKTRSRIAHWREIAERSGNLRNAYATSMADNLQQELDDRLANHKARLRMAEQEEKRRLRQRDAEKTRPDNRSRVRGSNQDPNNAKRLSEQDAERARGLGLGQRWDSPAQP